MPTLKSPILHYRPDIDGLRAIAVLFVILFHAWPSLVPGGFVGVDVFFVISGFLITGIINDAVTKDRFSFSHFYARRLRRLIPSLLIVIACVLVVGWITETNNDYRFLGRAATASLLFFANIFFYLTSNYFDVTADNNILLHMWSLGVEEQFYLFWPILVLLSHVLKRPRSLLLGISLLSFVVNVWLRHADVSADFYLLPSRLWELSTGGLLIFFPWDNLRGVLKCHAMGVGGLALILLSGGLLNEKLSFPGYWAAFPVGGAVLLIAAGSASWVNKAILSVAPLRFVGRISYQLYLWHWPLLVFARRLGLEGAWEIIGILVMAFAASWMTERFVERPFRFPRHHQAWLTRRAVPVLIGGVAVLLVLSQTVHALRLRALDAPLWVQDLGHYKYDWGKKYRFHTCFLDGADTFSDFCVHPAGIGADLKRPIVVLWGDSHAAHLYPGLSRIAVQMGFTLIQLTSSGCPPLVGVAVEARPHCQDTRRHELEEIARIHPDSIILGAFWGLYNGQEGWPQISLQQLDATLVRLHQMGIKKIVVVGPVPVWQPTLPDALIAWQQKTGARLWPDRIKDGLKTEPFEFDPQLRAVVERNGAIYVSALSVFCDGTGCLTLGSQSGESEPLTWDYGHLTDSGSALLAAEITKNTLPGNATAGQKAELTR
ncbi:MAG: acyltransferase family protein [Anaerolineaceae bacterium]|nr:acyltransferase family protein [Anaerolineaceae bacterium]